MQDPQKTPQCVPTATIAMLAMGCDDEAQDMTHISQCDRCSALLRDALEDLNRDPSADELKIAESIHPPKQMRGAGKPRWPLAIAAALFVLVSASSYRLLTPQHETLYAQLSTAYSAHRSMDLRLAGSEYSEVRIERSQSAKSPFAQIALAIAEGLEKNPNQSELLRGKGRLALLEGRYDEAISILEPMGDDETGTDLAAAYFQRGLQRSSREDREQAFSRYRAFVSAHPSDPVASFNLAVVAASIRPAAEARLFFEKYLVLETSPQWKQEAQMRMARLRVGQ